MEDRCEELKGIVRRANGGDVIDSSLAKRWSVSGDGFMRKSIGLVNSAVHLDGNRSVESNESIGYA